MSKGEEKLAKQKSLLGGALGFVTLVTTKVMAAVKEHGEEILLGLSEDKLGPVVDRFVADLVALAKAASNVLQISVSGNRTTEQVVAAGNYSWSNSNITSQLFPWRRRNWKRTIELVDMTQHGFPSDYSFADSLAVLQKLGLDRPVYEDGLLTGEQHSEKQSERPIMFPHESVVVDGRLSVVYLWNNAGNRKLNLYWTDSGWHSGVLVAGVRKS